MSPHVIVSSTKKLDAVVVAKTACCVIFFIVCVGFFAKVSAALSNDYFLLIMPTAGKTIPWLIRLAISSLLFAVSAGVVAVIVRPIWIAVLTYLVGAFLYVLIAGSSSATWIVAAIIFVCMSLYALYISKQLRNQVNFSLHPLSDMKVLLFSLLAALISVSFALGYSTDSARHGGYILPPEIKTLGVNYLYDQQKPLIDAQPGTKAQKEKALKAAHDKMQSTVDDMEKGLKPIQVGIPFMLGVSLFFIIQLIFILLSFVAMASLSLLFFILKVTHFTHLANEMREVTYITLEPVDEKK